MSQAAKSRKKAVEFEQLKQFDKAIAAYMRAIEVSEVELGEVDVALFNKVGDLTLRQGRVSDAVTYYERAVEHYVTAGLYNNAIALCNKILRSAPGRSTVYFSLGRICARKGLRGDATRNFLEYASRMQHEGRVDEGMRALAEVADLMPELTEVRRLVEEHAARAGITLPQRKVVTPSSVAAQNGETGGPDAGKKDLVFLEVDYSAAAMARMLTPPPMSAVEQAQLPPARNASRPQPAPASGAKNNEARSDKLTPSSAARSARLEDLFIFDPMAPGADAAFADDEESVVDGASLIIPTHPTDEDLPTPLTGLETTAVSDAIPDAASVDVNEADEDRANTLRETPHAVVTLDETAVAASESVLDASFIDLENPGVHRLVAPTPGLVSAMEFNLPEQPAEDLQDNSVVSRADDSSEEANAEPAVPEQADAIDVAAQQDSTESASENSNDDIVDGEIALSIAGDNEVFWLEPEDHDDSPVRDEVATADLPTPESASTIEFLDVDFDAEDMDDAAAVENVASDTIVETEHVADVDAGDAIVADQPLADDIVNDAFDADVQAEDVFIPVMEDLDVADADVATTALPWIDDDKSLAPVADDAVVPLLEGVTFDDENFAASLSFDATEPEDTTESLVVDALVLDDGRLSDTVDAFDASGTPEPLEGFVSEVAAPAETEFSFTGQPTPPFVRTERPAHADPVAPPPRANQHDLILPGELPPLMLPDECVQAGLGQVAEQDAGFEADDSFSLIDDALTAAAEALNSPVDPIDAIVAAPSVSANHVALPVFDDLDDLGDLFGSTDLPASVAAAEAGVVATSRRDDLQTAVEAAPDDWQLRRRLAHALFEVGERESALTELQAALAGLQGAGDLESASELADELVLVDGDKVLHHQKRVELAIRLRDDNRLRMAYLDLADMLVRSGDEAPARAVYVRVLEIDPWDDRARLALGDAAPPPPQVEQQDDGYVDLANWLRDDDEPASTRMRMREPSVTGNEQADFDSLLRHFKEGVARSLGEEDYESHYDLGVAYKEMGLLDDAVAEFQKALRSRTHRLPAYEALGQCFLEQESYQVAETVLSRALHEPGLGDEQRVGVLYLLGYACEALQRFGEARSYFERVYATDIHFRDVASRLATLDQLAR